MTWLRLALGLARVRAMEHLLTAAILALGIGLAAAAAAVGDASRAAVSTVALRYPVVVGPEVGAVPLVLGSLTRLQDVEAGVDGSLLEELAGDPRVEAVVPLLTGHAVRGFPVLGTSPAWLEPRARYPLADGRSFDPDGDEVVLGSAAAAGLGLGVGDTFTLEHLHGGAPWEAGSLKVVGVLASAGTDLDRTVVCPVAAIHRSHAHADDHAAHAGGHDGLISALLVRPRGTAEILALQEDLEPRPGVQVALTGPTFRRAVETLSGGAGLLRLLVGGVVLVTFLSLLLSTWRATLAQGRDVALMRVLGARRAQVVAVVSTITALVSLAGAVGGLGVASVAGSLAEEVLRGQLGLEAEVVLWSPRTLAWLGGAVAVLLLVGVQPALAAYRLEAAEALADVPGSTRTTRSWLRWSARFALPLAIFVWAQWAMGRHGAEPVSRPLDEASTAFFQDLARWSGGPPPPDLARRAEGPTTVEGWMYALGDPFEVQDFHLVGMDPRLPRCPFCYRPPGRTERIRVQTGGRTFDVAPGPVRLTGTLHLDAEAADPCLLELTTFEVVLDRSRSGS